MLPQTQLSEGQNRFACKPVLMFMIAVIGADRAMHVNMIGTMWMLLPAIHIMKMFIINDLA